MLILVQLNSGSLGHFVRDSEVIIRRVHEAKVLGRLKYRFVWYYFASNPSNEYFAKLLKGVVTVVPRLPFIYIDKILTTFSTSYRRNKFEISQITPSAIAKYRDSVSPLIKTMNYSETTSDLLNSVGLVRPYICLVVRDSGYDTIADPTNTNGQTYRHTPVSLFRDAIILMNDSGLDVIRMGRHSIVPIGLNQRHVIDYSFSPQMQSDERDVRLFENCEFTITTGSGPDELASFFRKNVYRLNLSPLNNIVFGRTFPLTLSSDYIDRVSGEKISLRQILDLNLHLLGARELEEQHNITIYPKPSFTLTKFVELVLEIESNKSTDLTKKINDFLFTSKTELLNDSILY